MSNKFIGKPTSREIEYSIVRNFYDKGKDKRFLIEVNNFLNLNFHIFYKKFFKSAKESIRIIYLKLENIYN